MRQNVDRILSIIFFFVVRKLPTWGPVSLPQIPTVYRIRVELFVFRGGDILAMVSREVVVFDVWIMPGIIGEAGEKE